ncbi:MAG: hypothetical protein KGH64_04665 [Candidatus Micrarchaeota archaeon]|nr:hypothetical protein [Candidatus Micrarchaeota archaeon]MDE1834605.1 hypothetical protein [Candidatus Micrarchaeota archaeon]MDE1859816.1 hypothetical protein [Candidatus Micrarchaeota archaeon]
MYDDFIGKYVIVTLRTTRGTEHRTIAYCIGVNQTHIEFESPAQKQRYVVLLENVISITLLPPEQLNPAYRRPEQKQEGKSNV